jgi:hypothetical protein
MGQGAIHINRLMRFIQTPACLWRAKTLFYFRPESRRKSWAQRASQNAKDYLGPVSDVKIFRRLNAAPLAFQPARIADMRAAQRVCAAPACLRLNAWTFARLPQRCIEHQRRRPLGDVSTKSILQSG